MKAASSSEENNVKEKNGSRVRLFDKKVKNKCWASAETVAGRHPEYWRKDVGSNIVCKRFCKCSGCLCFESDHILPFSKVAYC
ncbi:hypothetical protein RND81_08G199100 [Saponaria officinalis]|uniref:HNH endonuclease n=1 Tax=Saponaria officinalis TaxID=3572 RepID=A0AAW1J924_SAPOF